MDRYNSKSCRRARRPRHLLVSACLILVAVSVALPAVLPAQGPEGWPRSVLLTNDDGIESVTLHALAAAFDRVAKTTVVAPLANKSGSTNLISAIADRGLLVERRTGSDGIEAFGVDGYPGDAVLWAVRALLADDPPDLVVSGINESPNAGDSWIASGTIGAARIAAYLGIPALAVSGVDTDDPVTLRAVAEWVARFAGSAVVRSLAPGEYLIVNLPVGPIDAIGEPAFVPLASGSIVFRFTPPADPGDPDRQLWSLALARGPVAPDSDLAALAEGRIAITAMRLGEEAPATAERLSGHLTEVPPMSSVDRGR